MVMAMRAHRANVPDSSSTSPLGSPNPPARVRTRGPAPPVRRDQAVPGATDPPTDMEAGPRTSAARSPPMTTSVATSTAAITWCAAAPSARAIATAASGPTGSGSAAGRREHGRATGPQRVDRLLERTADLSAHGTRGHQGRDLAPSHGMEAAAHDQHGRLHGRVWRGRPRADRAGRPQHGPGRGTDAGRRAGEEHVVLGRPAEPDRGRGRRRIGHRTPRSSAAGSRATARARAHRRSRPPRVRPRPGGGLRVGSTRPASGRHLRQARPRRAGRGPAPPHRRRSFPALGRTARPTAATRSPAGGPPARRPSVRAAWSRSCARGAAPPRGRAPAHGWPRPPGPGAGRPDRPRRRASSRAVPTDGRRPRPDRARRPRRRRRSRARRSDRRPRRSSSITWPRTRRAGRRPRATPARAPRPRPEGRRPARRGRRRRPRGRRSARCRRSAPPGPRATSVTPAPRRHSSHAWRSSSATTGSLPRSRNPDVTTFIRVASWSIGIGEGAGDDVGEPHAGGVAVRRLGQRVAGDHPHPGTRRVRLPVDHDPPDHIGVHADTAHVLAHAVDEEHVEVVHREPRLVGAGQREQGGLGVGDAGRRDGLDHHRPVGPVLDDRHPEHDVAVGEHLPSHPRHLLTQPPRPVRVERLGLRPLAQADGDHLDQPALVRARGSPCGASPGSPRPSPPPWPRSRR